MSELFQKLIAKLFRDDSMAGSAIAGDVSSPLGQHLLDPGREGQIELVGLLQQLPSFAPPIPVSRWPAELDDGTEQAEGDTAWDQQQGLFHPADAMSGIGASAAGLSECRMPVRRLLDPVFSEHREAVPQDRALTFPSEDVSDRTQSVTLDRFALGSGSLTNPVFAPVGIFQQSIGSLAGQALPALYTTSASRPGLAGLADPRWVPTQDPGPAGRQAASWPSSVANAVAEAMRLSVPEGEDGSPFASSAYFMPVRPIDASSTIFGPKRSRSPVQPDGRHPDLLDPGAVGSWRAFSAVPPPVMTRRSAPSSDWPSVKSFNDAVARPEGHDRVPQTEANSSAEPRSRDELAPSALQVNGGVSMNGRRLGQVSASSQVRHASLPPTGQSRVNARSAALYPGTRIPQ